MATPLRTGTQILQAFSRQFRLRYGEDLVPLLRKLDHGDLKKWVSIGMYIRKSCSSYVRGFRSDVLNLISELFQEALSRHPDSRVVESTIEKLSLKDSKLWTISTIRGSLDYGLQEIIECAQRFEKFETLICEGLDARVVAESNNPNSNVTLMVDGSPILSGKSMFLAKGWPRDDIYSWNWEAGDPAVTNVDYKGLAKWLPEGASRPDLGLMDDQAFMNLSLALGAIFNLDHIFIDETSNFYIGLYDLIPYASSEKAPSTGGDRL